MKLKLNLNKGSEKLQAKKKVLKRGHILLVDDEAENLDGLAALLETNGYEVTASISPHEALEVVKNRPVDLIISDQRMPLMLGTELLSAVKAHTDDNIRVILTGHTDMNDLITCINNGLLYRYLVKPWNADVVLSVVEEGMKKIKIDRARERLLPKILWERLYAGRLEETSCGEGLKLECAVALIDIKDFNTISSHLTPSQVFFVLSQVMKALEPYIHSHQGYLAQRLGDGAIVVFDRLQDFATDAIEFAMGLESAIHKVNSLLSEDSSLMRGQQISLTVGLHVGELLLGSVGTEERLELTALGEVMDAVISVEASARELSQPDTVCLSLASSTLVKRSKFTHLKSVGQQCLLPGEAAQELFLIQKGDTL